MHRSPDKYLRTKIIFARIFGILVLMVSAVFSQSGFGFSEPNLAWVGWVLAGAVTVAELIFNTRVRELNWTIVTVGIMAYVYSIYTNIVGFYVIKGTSFVLNSDAVVPILGSIFMDIFPEMALAWSFGASADGDLIGNLIKVSKDSPFQMATKSTYVPKHKPKLGAYSPEFPAISDEKLKSLINNSFGKRGDTKNR